MKRVVIDTNVLIDFANNHADWLRQIFKNRSLDLEFILPTIVIAEYFTSTSLENEKEVRIADETFALFSKQDLTESIAKKLGELLRHKTYPPGAGLADLIIAATTIHFQAELATRNHKDFAKIPNLRFFDPKSISH